MFVDYPLTSPYLSLIIHTPPTRPEPDIPLSPAPRIAGPDPSGLFPLLQTLARTLFEPVDGAVRLLSGETGFDDAGRKSEWELSDVWSGWEGGFKCLSTLR